VPDQVRRLGVMTTHGRPEVVREARRRLEEAAVAAGIEVGSVEDGGLDVLVVLGGDGTMLRALRATLGTQTPVFGINFGRVGFLTTVGSGQLDAALQRAFAGDYRVVELCTLEARLDGATQPAVNDVVVTRTGAFFTDSRQQVLYRVPIGQDGTLGAAQTVPLTGEIAYSTSPTPFNANGIEASRGGKTLIIVQSNKGKIFTVDSTTGVTSEIELSRGDVTAGDGLFLRGRTLFVVQNVLNRVAVVKIRRGLREGTIVAHITDSDLDVPTTIDAFGGRLYAVNARFGAPSPETALYRIVGLRFP